MNRLTAFLLSSVLVVGAAACSEVSKTSANAPDSPNANVRAPDAETAQKNQADATSDVRRAQANADIRAREQRNNIGGNPLERADDDLASEVRSKLEVNLPASSLAVKSEKGIVTISGTVPNQTQLARIETLAKEIKGVKGVKVQATVAPAKPK
ncbi:BON domain-containing protein [Kamptonema formosum]|uniref:BON domain-containing protein n=1 Tax=Kamptonema formosum TaxID=331992 RepID=UPI00034A850B|nr:BON domain-containing protein [Oscillatoria sp. PCC 10802]